MTRHLLLLILAVSLLLPLGPLAAQEESSIPLYTRYCDPTRLAQGDEAIEATLSDLEGRLTELEDFLSLMSNGSLTFLEGIAQAEEALQTWQNGPIGEIACLAALDNDVSQLLSNILLAMLYGQLGDIEQVDAYLGSANSLLASIRSESAAATQYLALPVPTPQTAAPPTEEEAASTPQTPPAEFAPPSDAQLTALVLDFLRNNGAGMVNNAGVQSAEGNLSVNLVLTRRNLNGENLDYRNSLLALDVLGQLLTAWPELDQVASIRLETFDGNTRTLVIEAEGDAFRARYRSGELTQADFETSLAITELLAD
jgi:hypothetical protein